MTWNLLAQTIYSHVQLIATGMILVFLFTIILWVYLGSKSYDENASFQVGIQPSAIDGNKKQVEAIQILRGGANTNEGYRFKVKIANESSGDISDLQIDLISYPFVFLSLEGENESIWFERLQAGTSISCAFDFIKTGGEIEGEIIAEVSFVDSDGFSHSVSTRPHII